MLIPVTKTVTVTTSGTPVPLFSSSDVQKSSIIAVYIQAQSGTILIGDVNVSYTASPKVGLSLASTATIPFEINPAKDAIDLSALYVDASANGTVVNVLYFRKVSH